MFDVQSGRTACWVGAAVGGLAGSAFVWWQTTDLGDNPPGGIDRSDTVTDYVFFGVFLLVAALLGWFLGGATSRWRSR